MHATVIERLDLAADLSRAVEKRQLHLCCEPQISLASGRICGLEALVRWRHPTRGEVSPGEFIPLAEETGLILPIGRWVLREACRQVNVWRERWPTPTPLTIAINLSARQLQHPGVVDEVSAALAAAGLDPRNLVLEITETAIMEQLDAAITILTGLRRLGVRLALDDFGTGYSSLGYLQRLPVDILILKIDRSFVAGVAGSTEDSALARGILTLGQTLGLEVVAEGIETAEQLTALREFGCQLGQGYFFARPLGPTAVDALLERQYPACPPPPHRPTNQGSDIPRHALAGIHGPVPAGRSTRNRRHPMVGGNHPPSLERSHAAATGAPAVKVNRVRPALVFPRRRPGACSRPPRPRT